MRGRLGSFFRGIFSVEPLRPSRSRIKPAGGELKSKEEFFKFPSAPCRRRSDVERSRRSKTTYNQPSPLDSHSRTTCRYFSYNDETKPTHNQRTRPGLRGSVARGSLINNFQQ
ncbi:hypothetical protein T02_4829 [Trichinella nativa]|uniref:Uncharacterized protein n=1 Tax=Trichinella nativa TaxID=6335 RepID=A0A0V1L2I6_9BILA|nr:hypothetical protein T02_4829 [Trichinella nativa]